MVPRGRTHPLATRLPPPHAGERRRCTEPGCITLLCGYNPGPYCYGHDRDEEAPEDVSAALERDARADRKVRAAAAAAAA